MEKIKNLIKSEFGKRNSKPNHAIDFKWLNNHLLMKLNPKEQLQVNVAINELVSEGFILIEDRHGMSMILTEMGYEELYPINEEETISKMGETILQRFNEMNAKVGHIIDQRWLIQNFLPKFNPREQQYANQSIEHLLNRGVIEIKNADNGANLALTQIGFDEIY